MWLKLGLAWVGQTTAERHAMDKVGFLFEGFKVEYWSAPSLPRPEI